MKKLKFLFFLFLLIFINEKKCHAQSEFPLMAMSVATIDVANNYTVDSLPSLTDSTIFETSMQIDLYDTVNIQSIEVKVGSTTGASDILSANFVYDVSGSLGGGLTYQRNDYQILLGLGQLSNMLSYYSQVRVFMSDGTYSDSVVFNR